MKHWNKFLALALCCAMVLSCMPVAWAERVTTPTDVDNRCPHYTNPDFLYTWKDGGSEAWEEIPGDDRYHLALDYVELTITSCMLVDMYHCDDVTQEKRLGDIKEEHNYIFDNDKGVYVCFRCGHVGKCQHAHCSTHYETNDGYKTYTYAVINESIHSATGEILQYSVCDDCGAEVGEYSWVQGTIEEPHVFGEIEGEYFVNNVWCVFCRYVKGEKVPGSTAKPEQPTATPTVKPTAAPTVTPTTKPATDAPAAKPTATPTAATPTAEPTATLIPMPTLTPAPTAEPTSEPTSEPTAEPTAKPEGKPAAPKKPAATPVPLMQDLVEELVTELAADAEEGKEVTVEIVGADEVLNEEEYQQLVALPVQEQLVVTLVSIGYTDVVKAAVEALNITLSDEAAALMDTVTARMDAMTDEEKQAMNAKLAELFPKVEMEIDGETCTFHVIELKIVVDGEETLQKLGFCLNENNVWVFVKL